MANLVGFLFSLFFSSLLLEKQVKKKHPSDLVARLFQRLTNWLFYLLHIFSFSAALGPDWLKGLGRKQETGEKRSSYLCFRPVEEVRLRLDVVVFPHRLLVVSRCGGQACSCCPVVGSAAEAPRSSSHRETLRQSRRRRIPPVSMAVFLQNKSNTSTMLYNWDVPLIPMTGVKCRLNFA